MFKINEKFLVIIPARGGSKGIPRKNIKLLNGKPLILYTIELARALFNDTRICVSTEDNEIKEISSCNGFNIEYTRPKKLAMDKSSTRDVVIDVINFYEKKGVLFDTIILLQPTSPFRKSEHLISSMELYSEELDMVVSVKKAKSNPYYNLFEEDENGYLELSKKGNFTSRQTTPSVYEYNGAIYIFSKKSIKQKEFSEFKKVKKFIMSETDSIDLDEQLDWEFSEFILQKKF